MLDVSTLGTWVLGSGGLLTGLLALFSARSNKGKINSETDVNLANVQGAREQLYQTRENFWHEEVAKVKELYHTELENMRTEVAWLHVLIEDHVPWDWEVIRLMKLAGIEYRDPPTLNYIRNRYFSPEEK